MFMPLFCCIFVFSNARSAEGGEREGDGGLSPGLVELQNLESIGTSSGEATEPGEAGQGEQPAQAIGDQGPREELWRAQHDIPTYLQLLEMEHIFQHSRYPSAALPQELARIMDVPEATRQVYFKKRTAIWRRQQRPLRLRLVQRHLGRNLVQTVQCHHSSGARIRTGYSGGRVTRTDKTIDVNHLMLQTNYNLAEYLVA
ncbi:Rhox homeobox family member 2B [Manis javanica]|nr:Rhox homeobox family member 2B [Manis javanica]